MATHLLVIQLFIFGFSAWLGLYLIARDLSRDLLRYAGLGLLSFGLAMAFDTLVVYADSPATLARAGWLYELFLVLPVLFWVGTIIVLIPQELSWKSRLLRGWKWGFVPLMLVLFVLDGLIGSQGAASMTSLRLWLFFVAIAGMLVATLLCFRYIYQSDRPKRPLQVILAVTIFFMLGVGMLFAPRSLDYRGLLLFGIALDLELLGFSIAALDAFDEGESFFPDLLRSFHFTFFTVLFFVGLIVLTVAFGTGLTFPLLALLIATILAAIVWQTFSDPIEALLDRIALSRFARMRQSRVEYRAIASALPRLDVNVDFDAMDEKEFARLTRRALGHYGDLPRLAASPLTYLPLVDRRLLDGAGGGETLERASILKAILTDSIQQLKPQDQGDFGTSDEWRYYNALYFPYVIGLKPYSRRGSHNGLDDTSKEALTWFQVNVPTRTLYNWQNAAARLVAQDLSEQMARLESV